MATVVDVFALPIPKKHMATYRRMSRAVGRLFRRHGATEYREFVRTDEPTGMPVKPFTGGIRLKPGEVLITAIVAYPSAAARKRINKALEADPELLRLGSQPSPFDMKRMTVSTLETIVDV